MGLWDTVSGTADHLAGSTDESIARQFDDEDGGGFADTDTYLGGSDSDSTTETNDYYSGGDSYLDNAADEQDDGEFNDSNDSGTYYSGGDAALDNYADEQDDGEFNDSNDTEDDEWKDYGPDQTDSDDWSNIGGDDGGSWSTDVSAPEFSVDQLDFAWETPSSNDGGFSALLVGAVLAALAALATLMGGN